jgi:hypothetical protein
MDDPITTSCAAFISAVCQAKQTVTSRDAFWEDRNAVRTYEAMFKAIRNSMPSDLRWEASAWELAGSSAEHIWENEVDEKAFTKQFCIRIHDLLDDLASADWIACVPMERVFSHFPVFTSFGPFALINARATSPESVPELLHGFQQMLSEHLDVNFMPLAELQDSYLRLSDHYYQKSGYYIPGRPQMVLKVGRGERSSNERILASQLTSVLDLLDLCQIAYEASASLFETRLIGPHSTMPDGTTMLPGFVAVPGVAVAINVRTGEADWWSARTSIFETEQGKGYDPGRFMDIWNDIAVPVASVRNMGLSGKVREAIDSALQLVARCRHSEMGSLPLHAVIATETILNPFNMTSDIAERFALFSAALTETSAEKRRETYRIAKQLYQQRCHAVHRSRFKEKDNAADDGKEAFKLFLKCLKAIIGWASDRLSKNEQCNQSAFAELYLNAVFP